MLPPAGPAAIDPNPSMMSSVPYPTPKLSSPNDELTMSGNNGPRQPEQKPKITQQIPIAKKS